MSARAAAAALPPIPSRVALAFAALAAAILAVIGAAIGAPAPAEAQEVDAAVHQPEDAAAQQSEADASAETPSDAGVSLQEADAAAQHEPARQPTRLGQLGQAGETPWWARVQSFLGLCAIVALAWLMSSDRRRFPWRVVVAGVAMQLVFGLFVLKTPIGLWIFEKLNDAVSRLLRFTEDGTHFVFGPLMEGGFSIALNVLPMIVFFSSLMAILYHLGIMQWLVRGVAWLMQKTLETSGAETLSAAANIFVGQTEAPLVIRPFIAEMTRSELMAVMTGGFATVAGSVLAAYVGMLRDSFPDIAGHLIAASVLSAPASLVLAKVMVPETEVPKTGGQLELKLESTHANILDAATSGASEGLKLALNVGAMLLAFLGLIAMVNHLLQLPAQWHNQHIWDQVRELLMRQPDLAVPEGCRSPEGAEALAECIGRARVELGLPDSLPRAWSPISLQSILAYAFHPLAIAMGVPFEEAGRVASLLGEKMILNEFVAYAHLAQDLEAGRAMSHRATVITIYALCGFANLGSIAVQIGGIGAIAPERRRDLARLGLRSMWAGTLAAFMTACVAGILI